jgi:hypothetical protein
MFEPTHIELAKVRYSEQPVAVEQAQPPRAAWLAAPGLTERLRMVFGRCVTTFGREIRVQPKPDPVDR